MVRFVLAALLAVFSMTAEDPPEWGAPANGVRLSLAFDRTRREFQVTVENVTDRPVLVIAGNLVGAQYVHLNFQFIAGYRGQDFRLLDISPPPIVGGRVDPLVIPVVPAARYTVAVPLAHLLTSNSRYDLPSLLKAGARLRAELSLAHPNCPLYGYPNPNMIACWQGKAVSNALPIPAIR